MEAESAHEAAEEMECDGVAEDSLFEEEHKSSANGQSVQSDANEEAPFHAVPPAAPSSDIERPPSSNADANNPETSPGEGALRRSTRASALKAQKKLKNKDGMAENGDSHPMPELSAQTTAAEAEVLESPKKKRPRLDDGSQLDQYEAAFGIKMHEGDVVMMSDESEISSLNSEEACQVRAKWQEILKDMPSEETIRERERQIKELEANLRTEEAMLTMLKKTRANQVLSKTKNDPKKFPPVLNQNSTGTAYKPAVAAPHISAKVNGVHKPPAKAKPAKQNASPAGNLNVTPEQTVLLQNIMQSNNFRPDLIAQVLKMNPQTLNAFIANIQKSHAAKEQQQKEAEQKRAEQLRKEEERRKAYAAAQAALEAERREKEAAQTQQQRINVARNHLRRHLENQLQQLPPPKAPTTDMTFIPNPSQPDFCYLLGLDLVVQRNLKDKAVFKKVDFEPYVCEECGTDFTPNWKAIAGDKGDLHVYCEQCVRQAQKRKVRNERTGLFKKVFQRIVEQEKEFEKQAASGKFLEATTPSTSSANGTSTPSRNTSNFNAASLAGSSNAAKAISHSAAQLAATAAATSASAAVRNFQNSLQSQNRPTAKPDVKRATPTTAAAASSSSSGQSSNNRKRPASSNNNANLQLFQQLLAGNPQFMQQMQRHTQMSFLQNNPMLLALMSQPQLLQQLMQRQGHGQLTTQQQQQMIYALASAGAMGGGGGNAAANGSGSSSSSSSANSLAQFLQNNQQQLFRQMGGANFMQQLQQMAVRKK